MKSYIAYKNQRNGLKDVLETVKTTEKIAASSVHFLRKKVATLGVYTAETERTLARLSKFYRKKDHPFLSARPPGKKMLVIITGEKGLVGGLWHKIINTLVKNIDRYQSLVVIGAKGEAYLREEDIPVAKSFKDFSDIPEEDEIKNITDYVFNEFKKNIFSKVDILYPEFISLAEQKAAFTHFLPFEFAPMKMKDPFDKNRDGEKEGKDIKLTNGKEDGEGFPVFEPSKRKIFDELLRKYIGVFFRRIIMETKLSELSARTVATEHAATKTEEIIKKLTLDYAKERRRSITQRQLESFAAHKIT